MFKIDLGPIANYLSINFELEDILFPIIICLLISIILYMFSKRISVLNRILGIINVGLAIIAILIVPLFIFFYSLELSLIKQYILLTGLFFFGFLFALVNSRSVIKYLKESKSLNNGINK